MPYRITSPNGFTQTPERLRAGAADPAYQPLGHAPWVNGELFVRDDATAALAYYRNHTDDLGFVVEQVATADPAWAAEVARLRVLPAVATAEQVAAVAAEIEGT